MQLWDDHALTKPGSERPRGDTFVKDPGSAVREAGFHTQLARFIGWDLPDVVTYDAKRSPLYMQLIFPLLFVEQQTGWTGVRDNVRTYLRVREPALRSTQFLLNLQAADRAGNANSSTPDREGALETGGGDWGAARRVARRVGDCLRRARRARGIVAARAETDPHDLP